MLTAALAAYGLTGADTTLLRHNENMTYRVSASDGQYVLRIHQPQEGMSTAAFDGGLSPIELRRTEMTFLRHLHGKGLHVQCPVPTLRGDDVLLTPNGVCATLLTWLEGEDLTHRDCTMETARQLGALVFSLHQAAQDFHPDVARRYDASHCREAAAVLAGLSLPDRDKTLFMQALAHISLVWEARLSDHIMIHTDLSLSNVLNTPAGLAPIDFSLGGIGDPMFDLAVLSAQVPVPLLESYKAGYLEAGGTIDQDAYIAGIALGIIGMIVLFGEGMIRQEWFPGAMARWREKILLPLINESL